MSSEEDRTSVAPRNQAALLKALQKQVALLEDDLRRRTETEAEYATALRAEYDRALESERTASMYETWRDERVVQIAAAWVLACVFVRFSEDNGLIPDAWLSGPGDRLAEAQDRHDDFFRRSPELNDRDWLIESFGALADTHPTAAGLFDRRHNPLWEVTPSYEAATRLLAFWRERGAGGEIRYDFTDPELDTRFLGDLYQDLSEYARKTYALLQTPVFVEEFILDLTLDPAIEEFGLDPVWKHRPVGWRGEETPDGEVRGLRCIDPACGSGHFLLGMFQRVLAKWRETEPGTDNWVLIRRALESVHGADKNPFAASIARFRLLVAALKECGVRELQGAPEMPIRVAVGDSLLHGRGAEGAMDTLDTFMGERESFYYRTEDAREYAHEVDLLGRGTYHVVVANPPYITVKDKQENANYKAAYDACYRQYALSVPFAQRIFELAVRAGGSERTGGFTGQITANSFMKREFGKKLIEEFFPKIDLTHVIDTSGAFIPGHGTPTVILAGRNQNQLRADRVRAVLGVRGEPSQPDDAAQGLVWQAIAKQVGKPGSESDWVSVEDAERGRFATHPWAVSGGGAGSLQAKLEKATERLSSVVEEIGSGAVTREDSAYMVGSGTLQRSGIGLPFRRALVEGEVTRDFSITEPTISLWPYDSESLQAVSEPPVEHFLWPYRCALRNRVAYGSTQLERGLTWFEYSMFFATRYRKKLGIPFAFVATHNHFVLDRGGKVFNRSAPVIKLPEGASEEQHLELLGVLNSSTACFWMKQVSHDKGSQSGTGGFMHDEWERFFEFTGTKLQEFPLPAVLPLKLGRELDILSQKLADSEPSALSATPTRAALDEARTVQDKIRFRMILLQEELDWTVYGAYGLLTSTDIARTTLPGEPADLSDADVPQLTLGQRTFEIALARRVRDEEAETVWFERHGSTPIFGIPAEWPEAYQKVVQARLDLIESHKDIRLIERPEYKRRWSTEPWEKREAVALRAWLLDAAERKDLWFDDRDGFNAPCPLTVNQLADALRHDEDVQAVAALYAADHLGKRDASLATVLTAIIEPEHVPYLSALRYKETGLRKREQWERVWEQQREEDGTGQRLDIKVPPKYTGADFLKQSYWSNRGKLDVPKERFISYPDASTDNDSSLLLGWAGWNHREQAEALTNLINDRAERDGWKKEDPRFVPLLAGLQEAMPWVHQWYDEFDAEWDGNPAEEFQSALNLGRTDRHLSESDLRNWRPERKRGGRRKAAE
ncbi:BREX-2 system adenine-specific DNA-methyltransferase PglX [Streptomyces brevispora]|uniref:BREX-2 system adenine-specific DNA-methyltransferase PglX n=1 Tax=Streptomyces brevispora TaxID=887462 RepID=UPI0035DE059D